MGAVCQTLLNVAEFVAETFMDIPLLAVVMQARSGIFQGIDGVRDRSNGSYSTLIRSSACSTGKLIPGNDRGDGIAYKAHLFPA